MENFEHKLTAMFEEVEPQFRAETVSRYRNLATSQLEGWLKLLAGPQPERRWGEFVRVPQFVSCKGSYSMHWPSLQKDAAEGRFYADYERAEGEANRSVDTAKAHFVAKQTKKLTTATKNHAGMPVLTGKLHFEGLITGYLKVKYGNGDCFTLTMSIITNNRTGRYGGYTSFYQFPARFGDVLLGGEKPQARISEKWMEHCFRSVT